MKIKKIFCKCGCEKPVKWSKRNNCWNKYIYHHNRKGKGHSEESIKKMSEIKIGKIQSKEVREKNRKAHLGKKLTKKHCENISKARMGMIFSAKHRENIGKAQAGEKSHRWKGGISRLPYSQDWTETLRKSIRQRDNYTCQLCGKTQKQEHRKLCVHHIDYDKENCNPENLIALCRSCNVEVNSDREFWTKWFASKLKLCKSA